MNLSFLTIFLLFNEISSSYVITDKPMTMSITSSNKNKFFLEINICNYVKNDSYIMHGNKTTKIIGAYKYIYTNNQNVIIGGSDLKFIQSANFNSTFDSFINNKYYYVSVYRSFTKYTVEFRLSGISSKIYLFVIKDDNTGFFNLCDLLAGKNVVYSKIYNEDEYFGNIEFNLKIGFKRGFYKLIILEYSTELKLFNKKEVSYIETVPYYLIVCPVIFGFIVIIGGFIFLIYSLNCAQLPREIPDGSILDYDKYNTNKDDDQWCQIEAGDLLIKDKDINWINKILMLYLIE